MIECDLKSSDSKKHSAISLLFVLLDKIGIIAKNA